MPKISKENFLSIMSEKAGLSKKDCDVALKAFEETVVECLTNGQDVQLIGFMTLMARERPKREVRNPHTGEKSISPAKKVPKVRFGNKLKEAIANS